MTAYTYTVSETGYRIFKDGKLLLVQEDQFTNIYDGATMADRAQAHIIALQAAEAAAAEAAKQPTLESRVGALEAAQLAALGV